jgi:hypothetical protein
VRTRRPYAFPMKGRFVIPLLLLGLLMPVPGRAEAKADERVFDLHFWSHPRYIDPTYDFRAPPKRSLEEGATAAKPDSGRARSKAAPDREREAPVERSGRRRGR